MIELDRTTRDQALLAQLYLRLLALGSRLNSKIAGGPLYTILSACMSMMSDAYAEVVSLLVAYSPATATGAAQDQALGFFELPRFQPQQSEQTFTLMRTDASAALVIAAGASIQTGQLESGKTYAYKVLARDAATMPIGTYFLPVVFQSIESGSVTALTVPQVMQVVSGLSGVSVVAGLYDGTLANPLSTMTGTLDAWLLANLVPPSHFSMPSRVEGRDKELDDVWRARCFARWASLAVGSTDHSYETWARDFVDPDTGNSPVAVASVSTNQTFSAAVGVAPAVQPLVDGFTYAMGVEVAIAFQSGLAPAPPDLQKIADYLAPLIPHTDKVWVRPPNIVTAGAGSVAVTISGPASFLADATAIVESFFIYDGARPGNYQGLGATIYQSSIIQALRDLSPLIIDVKVVFTLAGKVVAGDIVLAAFDQISMPTPSTAITITVV